MSGPFLFEHRHRGHLWRLEVQTFKGRTFANWRKWFMGAEGWKPTKEGFTMPLDALWALTGNLMSHHGLEPPHGPETDS